MTPGLAYCEQINQWKHSTVCVWCIYLIKCAVKVSVADISHRSTAAALIGKNNNTIKLQFIHSGGDMTFNQSINTQLIDPQQLWTSLYRL